MNPEAKTKWLEALRSGKYKQTKSRLKYFDGFCCLGVLCDISGLSAWEFNETYLGASSILPREVMKWAGLEFPNPDAGDATLSGMNDGGCDFNAIADMIEEKL